MLRRSADLTVARVLLAEGRAADALALLEPARAAYESWGTVPELTSTLVLEAVAHGMAGSRDRAVEALGAAVRLAAPGGYVRRFVDDGPGLRALLPASGRSRRRSSRRSKARWRRPTTARGNPSRAGARRSRWAPTASWSSR